MKLSELGESGIIERIARRIKTDPSVIKGIGDDAAVIRWGRDKAMLFASDMIIEGVHFTLRTCTPFEIGWKALGVNLSDIAAMGGVPRYATVSLGLPRRLDIKFVDGLYKGMRSLAGRFGVNIVGGDTDSSDKVVIDVAIIGEAKRNKVVCRSGARPGDVIAVTGSLGGSIKGKHVTFIPRIMEARFLAGHFKISSMIDISDGLSTDLLRICKASRVGAVLYESLVPVSKDASSVEAALRDGEDFELLFTVPSGIFRDLTHQFRKKFRTPISAIGEITKERKGTIRIDMSGRKKMLKEMGFRHFR